MNQVTEIPINSLTQQQLLPMPDYKIAEKISKLSLLRMLPAGGSYSAAIAGEYLDMLRDMPAHALEKAIEDFRKGEIGDDKFMPFPSEIRRHALAIAAEENKRAKIEREEREEARNVARFAAGRPIRTPEELERMGKLADETIEAITRATAKEMETEQQKQARLDALMVKHDAIFADELDRVRARYFRAESVE